MIHLVKCVHCHGSGLVNPEFMSQQCDGCEGFGIMLHCVGQKHNASLELKSALGGLNHELDEYEIDNVIQWVRP